MIAFLYIPFLLTGFLALRTRLDIKYSPLQKINKYRQKLLPPNLFSKGLVLVVCINFDLYQRSCKDGNANLKLIDKK